MFSCHRVGWVILWLGVALSLYDAYRSVDWFVMSCVEVIDDVKDVQVLGSPAR